MVRPLLMHQKNLLFRNRLMKRVRSPGGLVGLSFVALAIVLTFRFPASLAVERRVYERIGGVGCEYDPVSFLRVPAYMNQKRTLPEHPEKECWQRTNSLGLREDGETPLLFAGTRVLVAGDSHTFGIVNNDESFANVLEAKLNRRGESRYDVLNAGVPLTGPRCYFRALQKYLYLGPSTFVAAIYLGNDFSNDVIVDRVLHGGRPEPPEGDYSTALSIMNDAANTWPGPIWQCLNQIARMKHFPEEQEAALKVVAQSCSLMKESCAANDIRLIVVLIPTKADVDLGDSKERYERLCARLGLTDADLQTNQLLGEKLADALMQQGIETVELQPTMAASTEKLYWDEDFHLSVRGHALVADALYARLTQE